MSDSTAAVLKSEWSEERRTTEGSQGRLPRRGEV